MIVDLKQHLDDKITIITPVYKPNHELFQVCVTNMLAQTHTNFMWNIIFDGKKSQGCLRDEMHAALADPRIRIIVNNKRKGVSYSRNVGLENVAGSYVGFLDCDNWYHIEALKKVTDHIKLMKQYPQLEPLTQRLLLCVGQAVIRQQKHYHNSPGLFHVGFRVEPNLDFKAELQSNRIDLNQCFFSKSDIRFDEQFTRLVDWDYILTHFHKNFHYLSFPIFLSFYDDFKRKNRITVVEDFERNKQKLYNKWSKEFEERFGKNERVIANRPAKV